jgi:membrane-bound serine protease (ClpP class)
MIIRKLQNTINRNKNILAILILTVIVLVMPAASGSIEIQDNTGYIHPLPAEDNAEADEIEVSDFYLCRLEGIIEPSVASYIKNCLERSEASGYGLIILMDTPGGLETSMREIITKILNTPIPVIVFVYPVGARAASAGVFITYSSDVAAMGPSTNIGAAHPVDLGGSQEASEDMMEKITNDSVSYIKNLAQSKERNSDWAEEAVRNSVSITAAQALEEGVIDYIAEDVDELLAKIDNQTIYKLGKSYNLKSSGAVPEEISMSFITRFLHIISNPNIAYILLSLGVLGIIYEFSQPGLGISGAIGALLLILGLYALSILPVNYAGLGLIILAVILFVVDILMGLGGIPSIAGVASLVIGSFLLINTDAPYLKIATSLIISVSLVISGFIFIVVRAVYKVHRTRPVTGKEGIVGSTAIVSSELKPEGQVRISGEIWRAVSETGKHIKKGEKVSVRSIDGLTLTVSKIINKEKEGG